MGRLIETRSVDANGAISVRRVNGYEGGNKVPSTFLYIDGRGQVRERTTYSDYQFYPQGDWIRRKVKTEETLNRKTNPDRDSDHRILEYEITDEWTVR